MEFFAIPEVEENLKSFILAACVIERIRGNALDNFAGRVYILFKFYKTTKSNSYMLFNIFILDSDEFSQGRDIPFYQGGLKDEN